MHWFIIDTIGLIFFLILCNTNGDRQSWKIPSLEFFLLFVRDVETIGLKSRIKRCWKFTIMLVKV
jgi:hypothetical protein